MEKNNERELDILVKKTVKEIGLEQPSVDFTGTVISRIKETVGSAVTTYRPLISRSNWLLLSVFVLGVFSYLIFGKHQMEITGIPQIQWDKFINTDFLERWLNMEVYHTFAYAILGLTFFVCIQVFILKHYLNKRYILD
ncbi:MAG: hypothetical protein WBG90_01480 [Saonia sp.]